VPRIAIDALAPTPWTETSKAVPFPLIGAEKPEKLQQILAHQKLGIERHRLPVGGSALSVRSEQWTM
jgi:hypothetical protein